MAAKTFADLRVAELSAPLADDVGQAWARALGKVQDDEIQLLRTAALARNPFFCPDDALDACGGWLKLPRFPGEVNGTTTTGYRGRLCVAWSTWNKATTKGAIIDALHAYGLPDVVVQNDYEVSPPWATPWFSRFRVLLGPTFGAFAWSAMNPPTAAQRAQITGIILQLKWAYAYPVDVVIDDGAGYTTSFFIGPLIGNGFIIGKSPIGGYQTL